MPVIAAARNTKDVKPIQAEFLERAAGLFQSALDETFRLKLGFAKDQDVADSLWKTLESLMRNARADWTLTFRELSYLVRDSDSLMNPSTKDLDYDALLEQWIGGDDDKPSNPLYEPLEPSQKEEWIGFLKAWSEALSHSGEDQATVSQRMLRSNPKFILREWMMVEAYREAAEGRDAELVSLFSLIQRPYDEGSDLETQKYYRRTPDESIMMGGTAFMS